MSLRSALSALGCLLTVAAASATPAGAQAPPAPPTTPRMAPAPGQVLSLQEAIDLALSQQPTLRSAQQGVNASVARVPQAQSFYYPRLDWITSIGRSQVFSTSSNSTIQSNAFSTALQARQLLYDFGKTGALVDEARANVRLSQSQFEQTREVVVLNVHQTYYQLLQARRLVAVADAQVARADLNLRSAKGFFDVGTRPKSDVTRAEVDVANAQVAQIRARNLVRFSEVNLANALGLEATTAIEIQDNLNFEPVQLDLEALRAEALSNRPELASARARIDAARAQLSGARAGYLPDLVATGAVGGFTDEPSLNLFSQDTWSVAGTLSWNLFQGFFTQSRVKETEANLDAAQANYDSFELQVRLEVEQASIAVVEAGERFVATGKAVESARENLRLAQGRYDAGVGTILDLTTAQFDLTSAEADQVRALTDHKLALAALDRAVGRP
jgi:TolC family type I secretion outer membrane protein